MADDIDDLLDEVETKYVEKKKNSAVASIRAKPKPRTELDDDISDILTDTHFDDEPSTPPEKQHSHTHSLDDNINDILSDNHFDDELSVQPQKQQSHTHTLDDDINDILLDNYLDDEMSTQPQKKRTHTQALDDDINDILSDNCLDEKISTQPEKKHSRTHTLDDDLNDILLDNLLGGELGIQLQKQHSRTHTLDDDLNDILLDNHLEDELNIQPEEPPRPVRENSTKGSGQKCLQVYLGGSKHESGHGTAITQRTCDQLRCTACDFKVCQFDDFKWASDTNYLFLRNNVPNFEKLRSNLSPSKGQRAYCCQCCWRTVKDLTVLNDPELKWHCGRH